MKNVFIAGANRTAIGKFGGSLMDWTAADMGVAVAAEAVKRAGLTPDKINEVIFGNGRQAGGGPNVARQIGYRAGIPETVPAYTVNQACGSGLRSIILAYNEIILGNSHVIVAGGTESMSRVPYYAEGARWGARLGNVQLTDGMYKDGFLCPLSGLVMGETAEKLADQYRINREEQDRYALRSQQRAEAARTEGRFESEITPLKLKTKKGEIEFKTDEHIFAGATIEKLTKLSPVFSKTGTVTAGNASGITDGAAALVVVSEEIVNREHVTPQARIIDYTVAGVDPSIMGIGPVPAVKQLLERQKLSLDKIDLVELNEAFAAQVLACDRELHFDQDRLNVNGGAIALGHPIGCTGTRIVVTLINELHRRNAKLGLATLCISGGMGIAMLIERV
ncbi:MAG TPA: thiolase family protein [Blastocatellia bacterium]|nr:thiolase family protein [Blastocatellia bacterium]